MKTVLLVDDDPSCREVMACLLQEAGFIVLGAADGREALERLRSGPLPQLILLDLDMPGMDGRAFRRVQRQVPVLSTIPVVILSGSMDGQEEAQALDVASYLRKPVGRDRLIGTVARHCLRSIDSEPLPVPR